MNKLIAYFIKYPIWANALILITAIAGILSLFLMPKTFFPEMSPNRVYVNVAYPGASPKEIEEGITTRIEENLNGVPGIKEITSRSSENACRITVTGIEGIDVDEMLQDVKNSVDAISQLPMGAEKPIIYSGGGVINSGLDASKLLIDLAKYTGFPITSTLMGLGAFPSSDSQFLGMLGMHGTYEANMAMHQADLIIAIGSRFDDRITGRLDAFSPNSKKIHIDIDPSSINKNVSVDIPIIGDIAKVLHPMLAILKNKYNVDKTKTKHWWSQINDWRKINCLSYIQGNETIKPQYAIETLYKLTKDMDARITTEVGQHQMWAAQFYKFEKPNRWMTSGGLGTMGYGLPAAIGVQLAHPKSLVVDIAGEASILMNIQEISTAVQYRLPVKIFILNNEYMGMVRQWQELLHGGRYSESYTEALPDFVKLAESFHAFGIRVIDPDDLESSIKKMIDYDGPVILDVVVDPDENCFPMIPSGSAHNEMMLGKEKDLPKLSKEGLALV